MAETVFSRGYKMKLIGTGLEAGTWGTSTNENLKRIDQGLGGTSDNFIVTAPPGESSWSSPTVIWLLQDSTDAWATGSDGRNRYINFTGTPGVNVTVNIRGNSSTDVNNERVYWVRNSMNGGFTIEFDGGVGSDFVLATGATALIYSDGSGNVAGILDNLQVSGLDFTEKKGAAVIKLPTNQATALLFEDPLATGTGFDFIEFVTTTGNEKLILGDVNIPKLVIDSPAVEVNSGSLFLSDQVVAIQLIGSDGSGETLALSVFSAGDEKILVLNTHTTRVEIPDGSTLDIRSGGTLEVSSGATLQVDAGSTLNIQSLLTADAGAVISGGPGTIDNQVIGGAAAVAGTFTTAIATTTLESPLLDATGASGQLKFNTLDVGLKMSSGVLQVKQTAMDAYGGLYASGQVSGEGVYFEKTGLSVEGGQTHGPFSHGFNPTVPRLRQIVLVNVVAEYGYFPGDEIDVIVAEVVLLTDMSVGATITVDNTNVWVDIADFGMAVLDRTTTGSTEHKINPVQDFARWRVTLRLWK